MHFLSIVFEVILRCVKTRHVPFWFQFVRLPLGTYICHSLNLHILQVDDNPTPNTGSNGTSNHTDNSKQKHQSMQVSDRYSAMHVIFMDLPLIFLSLQRSLPAYARVKQSRVPNAYDKTALRLEVSG